jgi:hypothetical protein
MSSTTKTILFIGASTGVGLHALKHTLAAGHRCIALCRVPSKLAAACPDSSNLSIIQGNAHDISAVSKCLLRDDGSLVDEVVSTIGAKPELSKLSIDDPHVCRKGMTTMLQALKELRRGGATGSPRIIVFSTTGLSRFGRDVPLAMVPLYHLLLKVPHEDKRIMEDDLAASGEQFTVVRASLLVNGRSTYPIRVGIEDPKTGCESTAIGYTISREDAGEWVGQNLLLNEGADYRNKAVTITY